MRDLGQLAPAGPLHQVAGTTRSCRCPGVRSCRWASCCSAAPTL